MRQRLLRSLAALVGLAALSPEAPAGGPSLDKGVPVRIVEPFGIPREAEPVTFAFPLPKKAGIVKPKQLTVLGPNGKPVPFQGRATQRWNAAPGDKKEPVRWMLLDFQADVPPSGEAVYTVRLRKKKDKKPKPPKLKVKKKDADTYEVKTGSAVFVVQGGIGLRQVRTDLDGDGKIASDEVALRSQLGFVLRDRFGGLYSSAAAPGHVTIEEKGKLRVVLRVDGEHAPVQGGIGRDFFTYRTRYTFYAGKPYVRVQHTVRNAYLEDPLGSIGFEGYAHVLEPGAPAAGLPLRFGVEDATGELSVAAPAVLRQDSDGGDDWSKAPQTTYRGYRVFSAEGDVSAQGDQASGWMALDAAGSGIYVVVRDFFENFPKALGIDPDGSLVVDLWPEETAGFFWLDDGQQKTHDYLIGVRPQGSPPADDLLAAFRRPLRPHPDAEWIRVTRAWADQGDLDDPEPSDEALIQADRDRLDLVYQQAFDRSSYAFGWSEFGEPTWAKNTHTTGSPRNKLTYFDKWAMTGSWWGFRTAELFALHSRDLRTYHIEGFSREKRPKAVLWEGLPPWDYSEDKLGRDQLDPALDPHRQGIPEDGHGWNGMDFEHMVADDLYEHYVLTGDWVTLDSLREMGEILRTWLIYSTEKAPGSSRGVGWTLRALVKIYQATGDPRFLESADDLVAAVDATYGRDPSPVTGLVYHYVTRFPPNANHIPDDEYDLPWQLGVVIHGMMLHHRETGSKTSRRIALDVADYIVDYAWNGVAMNESLAVDDHTYFNYKGDNTGVNTWIPSALAIAYREDPRPEYLFIADFMYHSIPGLTDPTSYIGYGLHHWWHGFRSLVLGY